MEAVDALATTIDRDDPARLTYTRHVRIDETAARSFSHPVLTLRVGEPASKRVSLGRRI